MVSIIVRTKDRPELLKRAIASVASQTYRPIEVVLVNDGGCDLDIKELKAILGDITLNHVRLDKNIGRAHAANVGIENAHGDYIGFLDDDDEFYPEHLHILTEALKKDELKIVYTDAEMVFAEIQGNQIVETYKYVFYSHEFSPAALLLQNHIPFMCLLFSRDILEGTMFDETFDIFEDWVFLIKLSQKYWFRHIKKVTAKYIQWSDESQINRRALSEDFSKEAYMRVLDRNSEKISSEAIYIYCVYNTTEKQEFLDKLIKEEGDYFKKKRELTNELTKLRSEKRRAEVEKKRVEAELQDIAFKKRQIEIEKDRLHHELVGLHNYFTELSNSLSWILVERYRRLKNRIAPLGTKRRGVYDLLLKSVKVLINEGMKGFLFKVKKTSRKSLDNLKFKWKPKRLRSVCFDGNSKIPKVHNFIQKPVHIIMPVYNGYECIMDCIDSVLRNTDLYLNTLVIIDDKSTDSHIHEYLKQINTYGNGKNINILYNQRNVGFTKTINKGMKSSPEDVIILNSDTIVTKNWVDKLQRASYSKPRIATATPLSNYITINGIPEPFRYNTIPNGMNVDTFGDFIDKISLRYYPEIPAGVGFCMYIKRSVLDEIGYFDEDNFGKGYAEETDFCMRALKRGYTHVIDDATYIYHIGGVSFESVKDPEVLRAKNLMIGKNLETLKTLHPEYADLVEKSLHENLSTIHKYINLRIKLMENSVENPICDRSKA
jgi:GT2 family glycosyltransferase